MWTLRSTSLGLKLRLLFVAHGPFCLSPHHPDSPPCTPPIRSRLSVNWNVSTWHSQVTGTKKLRRAASSLSVASGFQGPAAFIQHLPIPTGAGPLRVHCVELLVVPLVWPQGFTSPCLCPAFLPCTSPHTHVPIRFSSTRHCALSSNVTSPEGSPPQHPPQSSRPG